MAGSPVPHVRLAVWLHFGAMVLMPACRTQPGATEPEPAVADAPPVTAVASPPKAEPTPAPEPAPSP
jgi:hypothetical protein